MTHEEIEDLQKTAKWSQSSGCIDEQLPFKHLNVLTDDTDEEFLSDYFHSQVK
jgi:hypothetical protein